MTNSDNIRCIRKYQKKDGSITYHAEVRRKHAKPLRKKHTSLTAAKNWVRSMESAILEGRAPQETKTHKYTLYDLIEKYKTTYLNKFPKRINSQIHHLNWWQKHYGNKLLIEITPSILFQAKDTLLSEYTSRKTLRSGPTVNRYFATLSKAFSLATCEWEWLSENPVKKISKLPESKGRSRFLSKEELQALLKACQEHKNPNLYGMVLIAAALGLRFGEIVNLKWQHIDFENKLIILEKTKNQDIRVLPISDQLYFFLQNKAYLSSPDKYIFPSKIPSKRSPPSMIRKAFTSVIQALGLQDVVFHTLRHTAASHMAMSGATQGELMEVLGHRSPTMTKRYAHFNKAHIAKLIQKTNDNIIYEK